MNPNEDTAGSEIELARPALMLPADAGLGLVSERLVDQTRTDGVTVTGQGGLLAGLVQQVPQTALESEVTDHLGYEPHAIEGPGTGNSPATATTPRRCAPRSVMSESRCPGTVTAASSRSRYRSASAALRVWTRWSSRFTPKG